MISNDAHQPRRPVFIIGFMGSGKTTVARELARALNSRAIDLDELISEREKRSPGEIIEQSGEDEFRRIETELLCEVLLGEATGVTANIIALGGGAWTLQRNRDLITEHQGITIWLDVPFEVCWQRIQTSGEGRPLARDERQARMLYAERRPQYALAELQLPVDKDKGADEIYVDIVEALRIRNS